MTDDVLTVKDSSRFGELTDQDRAWLRNLQRHLRTDDHVIRLGAAAEDEEPVVFSDAEGMWRAGRYIGSLHYDGRRLDIEPRYDFEVLLRWLDSAFDFIAVPQVAKLSRADSFVPWLLALLWARRLDVACKHGLPSLRLERTHTGLLARGSLDVRRTVRLRQSAPGHLASRTRERSLKNDIVRTLVAAENALRAATGSDQWQSRRVRDYCSRMREGVGANPSLPRETDLVRIRYPPIRAPFRDLVAFSYRLARRRGYISTAQKGRAEGILLDVAELWELFLVDCVRAAAPALVVQHGTRTLSRDPVHLLRSTAHPDVGLGRLQPDILVRDAESAIAVLDAKYKSLSWAPDRPDGVDRGDRYQLVAYLTRFRDGGKTFGALLYPEGMADTGAMSRAERDGPWLVGEENRVHFARMPVTRTACVERLTQLLAEEAASRASYRIIPASTAV